jgi:peptidase inhibitor family I36
MGRDTIFKVLAGMAIAGTVIVLPGTAQAAPYQCKDKQDCFFKELDSKGTVSVQARLIPDSGKFVGWIDDFRNSHYTDGSSLQDSVSSVVNNTDRWIIIYDEGHRHGIRTVVGPHSTANLNYVWAYDEEGPIGRRNMDNVATSAEVVTSCNVCY